MNPDSSITISLTQGQFTTVSPEDIDLAEYKWCAQKTPLKNFYAIREMCLPDRKKKRIYMHRHVLERKLGRPLTADEFVDHIDGNSLNNRRDNLRLATKRQNNQNQKLRTNNTSGYKGVIWSKQHGKWLASIKAEGKRLYLGFYTDPKEAHEAYKKAAQKYFGEFARFE